MSMMAPILLLLFCLLVNTSFAGFTEIPQTRNVTAGVEAEFRCQHSNADFIGWRVNNTSVERSSLTGISQDHGTLTILALPEYNGTVVECVALYFDGSTPELTPPAYLIVEGSLLCVPGTNCSILNESLSESNFLEEPSSINTALGDQAVFRCRHATAEIIAWDINGISIGHLRSLLNISSGSQPTADGVLHTLTVVALEAYNNTNVSCVAAYFDPQYPVERTPNASLVVQGLLGSVKNLKLSIGLNVSTLTWDPPFSLDLTSIHPDVTYCVDIYNTTCGRVEHLVSDCNVVDPYFTSYNEDEIRKFIVTPRSNVANSKNGTATFQSEGYRMFNVANLEPVAYKDSKSETIQLALKVHLNNTIMDSHSKLLSQYSIQLKAKDAAEPTVTNYTVLTTTVLNEIVLEFSDSFQYGRLWEGLLLGINCGGIPLSERIDLSTHEVHNVSVDQNIQTSQLSLTWNFINGSNAPGVLTVTYPLMYDSDTVIHYDVIIRPTIHSRTQTTLLGSVSGNQYNISMFVLLENGQPFTRSVAKPFTVTLSGNHELFNNPSLITAHATNEDNGVCVTCFIDSSSNGTCLLVVHPKPSSLHSHGGLSNIDVVLLNKSGSHRAGGCIQGISLVSHVIAAFLYDETQVIQGSAFVITPQNASRTMAPSEQLWIILTSGLFVVIVFLVVVIISIGLAASQCHVQKKDAIQHDRESRIELKRCDAYEVPRLLCQKVVTERNPAYETVVVGSQNGQI